MQEMDAATFKDISSQKWHIGVVRELKLDISCPRFSFSTLESYFYVGSFFGSMHRTV